MSRLSIELALLAEHDLEAIATYSAQRWGDERAVEYMASLGEHIELLAVFPDRGVWMGSRYPGIRKISVGRHVIYYRYDDQAVFVARVLHERLRLSSRLLR